MQAARPIAELRESVAQRFRDHLRDAIESTLSASEDVLWDWAYNSMRDRTFDCLDLMRTVKSQREEIVEEFLRQFDRGVDRKQVREVDEPIELRLVDEADVDLQAAVNSFVRSVEGHSETWQTSLKSQLQRLDEDGKSPPLAVHIGAGSISDALRAGAEELGLEAQLQIILFKLFEQCAVPTLVRGYTVVSKELVDAGVKPQTPKVVIEGAPRRSPPPPMHGPDLRQGEAGHAAASGAAGLSAAQLQQLVQSLYAGTPMQAPTPTQGGVPMPVQQFATQQLPLVSSVLNEYADHIPASIMQQLLVAMTRIVAAQPDVLRDASHPVRSLLDQVFVHGQEAQQQREVVQSLPVILGEMASRLSLPRDWGALSRDLPSEALVRESVEVSRRHRARHGIAAARQWALGWVNGALEEVQLVPNAERWVRAVFVPFFTWIRVRKDMADEWLQRAQASLKGMLALLAPERAASEDDDGEHRLLALLDGLREAGAKEEDLRRISLRFRELQMESNRLAGAHSSHGRPPAVGGKGMASQSSSDTDHRAELASGGAVSADERTQLLKDSAFNEGEEADAVTAAQADADAGPGFMVPDALQSAHKRAVARGRIERFVDFVREHFPDPDIWWRVDVDGNSVFARLAEVPKRRGAFRFSPMFGDTDFQLDASVLLNSMVEKKTRPLRSTGDFLERLRRLQAESDDADDAEGAAQPVRGASAS